MLLLNKININFFIFFVLISICFCDVIIVPEKVIVYEGDSYTLYLKTNEKLTIDNCSAQIAEGNVTYKIDPSKVNQEATVLENPQNVKTLDVRSLGNNICGFIVINSPYNAISTAWTLTMVDKTRDAVFSKTARLITYQKSSVTPQNQTIEIARGESLSIICGSTENKNIEYCELFSPKGASMVRGTPSQGTSCSYETKLPTSEAYGTWICKTSIQHLMEPIEKYIIVKKIERNVIRTWMGESDAQVSLGCNLTRNADPLTGCTMVRPDGYRLLLEDGYASERYRSIGTDFNQKYTSQCVLQIMKPLKDFEYGTWSCEIGQKYSVPGSKVVNGAIGGFITIKKSSTDILPAPRIPTLYTTSVNSSLKMECKVFYSSPYCYFRSPNGTFYPVENDRSTTLGYCSITINLIQLSDNGTWTCAFSKNTGTMDDTFSFQVLVKQARDIKPVKSEVITRTGSTATLICSTKGLGDRPLQYCRFLSPNGKMYYLSAKRKPNSNSTERLQYAGRGLEYGDCGVRLSVVESSDDGIWSCITRLGSGFTHSEIYDNISLNINDSEDLTTASVIGIAAGVIIIISGLAFFIYTRYRRNISYPRGSDLSIHYQVDDETTPTINPTQSVNIINYSTDDSNVPNYRRRSGRGTSVNSDNGIRIN